MKRFLQFTDKLKSLFHTVAKPRRMAMQTIEKEQCSEIIQFQPFTCTKRKCNQACKATDQVPSNEHDQCLPRDDGYDGDDEEEDNVENGGAAHKKVILGHKQAFLHGEKVHRHHFIQRAMPKSENEDSEFQVQATDECCCAPTIPEA